LTLLSALFGSAFAQNLIGDPAFSAVTAPGSTPANPGWYVVKSASAPSGAPGPNRDCDVRHDGNCSVKLINAGVLHGNSDGDAVVSVPLIDVTPGRAYTFSFYAKTDAIPQALISAFVQYRTPNPDDSHGYQRNSKPEYFSVSRADDWQEVVLVVHPQADEQHLLLYVRLNQPNADGVASNFWIADAFFGEGIVHREAPAEKLAFDGGRIKVDALGNLSRMQNGVETAFFPLCIYTDYTRPDWSLYAAQGFNCAMRASSLSEVRRAAQNGLLSGYQFAQYVAPINNDGTVNPTYNDWQALSDDLATLAINGANHDLLDSLLFFYWDNENSELPEWSVPAHITQIIRDADLDNGVPMHPIYSLQGSEGLARKYNPGVVSGGALDGLPSMSDLVGTYVRKTDETRAQGTGHYLLEHQQHQVQPVTFAQLNADLGYGGHRFIAAAYSALAHGARGLGFWKDCYQCAPNANFTQSVELYDWWSDLPRLAATLRAQTDLLRSDHDNVGWSLTGADDVQYGNRLYRHRGYVIIGNESDSPVDAAFTFSGLNYTPRFVQNMYSGDVEATISNGSFTLPIAANDGGIYRLDEDALVLNLAFNGDLRDGSGFGNDGEPGGNAAGAVLGADNTLNLDGSGYIAVNPAPAPATRSLEMNRSDLSVIVRARIDNADTSIYPFAMLIGKGASTPTEAGYMFFYDIANDRLAFWFGSGNNDRQYLYSMSGAAINDGRWHTLAVSVDRAASADFYKDGALIGSAGAAALDGIAIVNPAQALQVGATFGAHRLQGALDNVRVYKTALSGAAMQMLSANVLSLGLQNEGGDARYDRSLFGSDIVSTAFFWNGDAGAGAIGFWPNAAGYSATPIRVRDNVDLELDANTDFSIGARLRFSNGSGHAGIVAKGAATPANAGYVLTYYADTHRLGFWPCDGSERGYYNSNPVFINDGAVHDVVVTFSRGARRVQFYVDGADAGGADVPASLAAADFTNAQEPLTIGSWVGHVVDGAISNVFIDRAVISNAEIQRRHALPQQP